jgi:hypothetical protein
MSSSPTTSSEARSHIGKLCRVRHKSFVSLDSEGAVFTASKSIVHLDSRMLEFPHYDDVCIPDEVFYRIDKFVEVDSAEGGCAAAA